MSCSNQNLCQPFCSIIFYRRLFKNCIIIVFFFFLFCLSKCYFAFETHPLLCVSVFWLNENKNCFTLWFDLEWHLIFFSKQQIDVYKERKKRKREMYEARLIDLVYFMVALVSIEQLQLIENLDVASHSFEIKLV